ncbi:helix-turn-helix transcriptional regulator [Actinomadura syzygii]|uniref:Helix-turn-helix transcriptional regulator n=1 Tax=Actinomadura syzygii TaxID=1427538 RepID=A0A5D0U480_9ACTN|nr:helix-turn-helix transcriptional regulator [Actinomadura syzygii]TYC12442.1 helix-turn-helix transcriptional regulator [Actinomadura syzygii]
MSTRRTRSSTSPTLIAFGRRFRRFRDAKGWTQEGLALRAHGGAGVKPQYIGAIENGRARCTEKFAAEMDEVLEAGGELLALWHDLAMDATFPAWFDWVAVEGDAVVLASYSLSVVHGLLQVPAYAEAILHGDKDAVTARMSRQAIFTRSDPPPPDATFLLDTQTLDRPVGTPDVMVEQLEHLAMKIEEGMQIQIVSSEGTHLGNTHPFTIATLEDMQQVAYVETLARGFTMAEPTDLVAFGRALRQVQGLALPVAQSLDEIRGKATTWKQARSSGERPAARPRPEASA